MAVLSQLASTWLLVLGMAHHASSFGLHRVVSDVSATSNSVSVSVSVSKRRSSVLMSSSYMGDTAYDYLISTDEATPRDIASMEQWAEESAGIQRSPSLQLTGTQDPVVETHTDVFAYAAEYVAAESSVLIVPSMSILSSNRAMAEIGTLEEVENLITSLNARTELRHFYLMAYILAELEKGVDSPYYAYFNSMPRYYSNAASMTSFCFECLPPLVSKLAQEERRKYRALTGAAVKRIPFLSDDTKYNRELIKFAFQIVYTRTYEQDGDIKLIPMVDYFNHNGADPNVYLSYDADGNCYAQTTRDVQAGEPLTMLYGDPTNPSHLFARYGFLDETSEATFCKIIPAHINEAMKVIGYAENTMLFYNTGEVSSTVWDYLLYQALSRNTRDKRAFLTACVDQDWQTKQSLHEQFAQVTYGMLLEHIDQTLQLLEKLGRKTQGKNLAEHPRIPVILAHNDFVKQTFLRVRATYFGQ